MASARPLATAAPLVGAPGSLFRTLAIAEAVSWTLLLGGILARATLDAPIAVTIGGSIHGFVSLAYGATTILLIVHQRWGPLPSVLALVSAVLPYATIPLEWWLRRSGRLEGEWRTIATDDPRDRRQLDRVVRWTLRHPIALALGALAVVTIAYVALLLL